MANMKRGQISISMVMASGILAFAGCSLMVDEPKGTAHIESTPERQTKTLAGSYKDIGSDGSIKPHSPSAGTGGRIFGTIELAAPTDGLDHKTGKPALGGTDGGTMSRFGYSPNNTGSSAGTNEAGGK
jgi:hypothetical protein